MSSVYRFRRNRARNARVHRSETVRSRYQAIFTLALFVIVIGVVGSALTTFLVYRSYANDLKPPDEAITEITIGSSLVYDRTGQRLLYEWVDDFSGLKEPVPLTEMSPYIIAATIATEDQSFYDNPGVNFRGLARAAVENLTPFGPGFLAGSGGSSITQQLVKNVYISEDERFVRRIERKIKETVIALELKRQYDDHQILEWYLNQLPYANQAFGVEGAAQRYFGKHASELTLAESALLAGLPQAPGLYSPAIEANRERAKARQLEVLDLMIRHLDNINEIPHPEDPSQPLIQLTEAEIEAAKQDPLDYVDSRTDIQAPHFVFLVEDHLKKMCFAGMFDSPGRVPCDRVVTQGGLRVTTTIDMGLQAIGEQIVEEEIAASEVAYRGHNGSLVAIRPETGEVLTYVGSRDFSRSDIDGQVDIASSLKSHGSTMKVFTYLSAFEQGWVPSTFVRDEPLFLETGGGVRKQVNNWNFSHMGNITVRKALSESVNTTAVRTLQETGMQEMQSLAQRIGITDLRRGDCGPTITLGACEVKLLDMTFAFATIANNGAMMGRPTSEDLPSEFRELDPVTVLRIEDADGNLMYEYETPEVQQALNAASAYMVTDILSREAISWSRLTFGFPAAAKTGTSEEFRDGVVMGYSRDLATGVWMGNADNAPMAPGTFSSVGVGPMWKRFMESAHEYLGLEPREFEPPEAVVAAPCGGRQELFKRDETPTKTGACRAPAPSTRPGEAPPPSPRGPQFPVRTTPAPSPTPEPTPFTPEPTPFTPELRTYAVRDGDTLEDIALRFGVTPALIVAHNDITFDTILFPGQVLVIPVDPGAEPQGGEQAQPQSTHPGAGPGGQGPSGLAE